MYRVNLFYIMVTFLKACTPSKDHLEGLSSVSPAFLAVESFHNFAFLRTDGEETSPTPSSKFLAQYVCRRQGRSQAILAVHIKPV